MVRVVSILDGRKGDVVVMGKFLILLPLFLLIGSAMFYVVYTSGESGISSFGNDVSVGDYDYSGNQTLDGNTQELEQQVSASDVNFSLANVVIGIVVASLAIVVISGINILGSGLSDVSVSAIGKMSFFYGLWFVVSAVGILAFLTVPYQLGLTCYFVLSLCYAMGVWSEIR